jgi:hypothetical protein
MPLLPNFHIHFSGQSKTYLNLEMQIVAVIFYQLIILLVGCESQMVIWQLQQYFHQMD